MLDVEGPSTNAALEGKSSKQAHNLMIPLRQYHTVFLLDDWGSMREPISADEGKRKSRWDVLVKALQYFGDIAAQSDDDGITINFLYNRRNHTFNVRSGQQALGILVSIDIARSQSAQLDLALWDVLKEYLDTYHQYYMIRRLMLPIIKIQVQPPKPLNMIVIISYSSSTKCAPIFTSKSPSTSRTPAYGKGILRRTIAEIVIGILIAYLIFLSLLLLYRKRLKNKAWNERRRTDYIKKGETLLAVVQQHRDRVKAEPDY
jgi:hypothetical protein